jgi:hypothetical protein
MARFDEVFDVNEMPEGGSFDPLPAGWYPVEIVAAEIKDTKSGTGKYLSVSYQTDSNRLVFGNLNIRNANSKAEEIARQQLGDLMRAVGLSRLQDSDQLIGLNLQIKLTIKEDPQYGARNEIKAFKALAGGPGIAKPQPTPVKAATAKAAPPWAKPQTAEGSIPF